MLFKTQFLLSWIFLIYEVRSKMMMNETHTKYKILILKKIISTSFDSDSRCCCSIESRFLRNFRCCCCCPTLLSIYNIWSKFMSKQKVTRDVDFIIIFLLSPLLSTTDFFYLYCDTCVVVNARAITCRLFFISSLIFFSCFLMFVLNLFR